LCFEHNRNSSNLVFILLKMTVAASGVDIETDSLEIAKVVQTIKTIDLAEDDAQDIDFVASEEELEVKVYF
jgi:hypothetical protein